MLGYRMVAFMSISSIGHLVTAKSGRAIEVLLKNRKSRRQAHRKRRCRSYRKPEIQGVPE